MESSSLTWDLVLPALGVQSLSYRAAREVPIILFLIPVSPCSLSAYTNMTDFYVLILYPVTLLNLLVPVLAVLWEVFKLVDSLGLSMQTMISSASRDGFISSFPTCMYFIFSCLIVVAGTSGSVLNKSSGKADILVLF